MCPGLIASNVNSTDPSGDPEFAAYLAKVDGEVSHSGEGIYSGQAVAAAISIAMTGAPLEKII